MQGWHCWADTVEALIKQVVKALLQDRSNDEDTVDEPQEQVALARDVAYSVRNTLVFHVDMRALKDFFCKLGEMSASS